MERSYKEDFLKLTSECRQLRNEVSTLKRQNEHLKATLSGLQKRLASMRKKSPTEKTPTA